MRWLFLILILILITLQYKLWLGDGNIAAWQNLEYKIRSQDKFNQKLFKQNQVLEADILELKNGNQALEEQARNELGMLKDDEVYYQFVE